MGWRQYRPIPTSTATQMSRASPRFGPFGWPAYGKEKLAAHNPLKLYRPFVTERTFYVFIISTTVRVALRVRWPV